VCVCVCVCKVFACSVAVESLLVEILRLTIYPRLVVLSHALGHISHIVPCRSHAQSFGSTLNGFLCGR
jgi:hypothetical protein